MDTESKIYWQYVCHLPLKQLKESTPCTGLRNMASAIYWIFLMERKELISSDHASLVYNNMDTWVTTVPSWLDCHMLLKGISIKRETYFVPTVGSAQCLVVDFIPRNVNEPPLRFHCDPITKTCRHVTHNGAVFIPEETMHPFLNIEDFNNFFIKGMTVPPEPHTPTNQPVQMPPNITNAPKKTT